MATKFTKDDFKRECCISDSFIARIDELTFLKSKESLYTLVCGYKYEMDLNKDKSDKPYLFANIDCRFLGRYYKISDYFRFWIGYDFRKEPSKRFYISFYTEINYSPKKEENQNKIKDALESCYINYEAEYYKCDGHYWYNVTLDINLLYLKSYQDIHNEIESKLDKITEKLLCKNNVQYCFQNNPRAAYRNRFFLQQFSRSLYYRTSLRRLRKRF